VTATSEVVKPGGGTKKSSVLVAVPFAVVTEIFPELPNVGTLVEILVEVAELTRVFVIFSLVLFFVAVVSKFVPVTVIPVPLVPMVGEIAEIVGVAADVTVKDVSLETEFPETVTWMTPVVAPLGTVVVILVAVEAVTVAAVPLKVTVLLAGVALNAVP
jgi:hypothetical protein